MTHFRTVRDVGVRRPSVPTSSAGEWARGRIPAGRVEGRLAEAAPAGGEAGGTDGR
jgi:hypothetical protein